MPRILRKELWFWVIVIATEIKYSRAENEDGCNKTICKVKQRYERDIYDYSEEEFHGPSNSESHFNIISWWKGVPRNRKEIKQTKSPELKTIRLLQKYTDQMGMNSLITSRSPQTTNQVVLNTNGMPVLYRTSFPLAYSSATHSTLGNNTGKFSQYRQATSNNLEKNSDSEIQNSTTKNDIISTSVYQTTCYTITDSCAPIMTLFDARICSTESSDFATVSGTGQSGISTATSNNDSTSITGVNTTSTLITGVTSKFVYSRSQAVERPVISGTVFPILHDLNTTPGSVDPGKMQELIECFQNNLRKDIYNETYGGTKATFTIDKLIGRKPVKLHTFMLVPFSDSKNIDEHALNELAAAVKGCEPAVQTKNHQNIKFKLDTSSNKIEPMDLNKQTINDQLSQSEKIENNFFPNKSSWTVPQPYVNFMSSAYFHPNSLRNNYSTFITGLFRDGENISQGILENFNNLLISERASTVPINNNNSYPLPNDEIGFVNTVKNESNQTNNYSGVTFETYKSTENFKVLKQFSRMVADLEAHSKQSRIKYGKNENQAANRKDFVIKDTNLFQINKNISNTTPLLGTKMPQNITKDETSVQHVINSNQNQKVAEIHQDKFTNSSVGMECYVTKNNKNSAEPSVIKQNIVNGNRSFAKIEMNMETNGSSNIHLNSPKLNMNNKIYVSEHSSTGTCSSSTTQIAITIFSSESPKINKNILWGTEQMHTGYKPMNITDPLYDKSGKIKEMNYNITTLRNGKLLGLSREEIELLPFTNQNTQSIRSTSFHPIIHFSPKETSNMNNHVESTNLSRIHVSELEISSVLKYLNELAKYFAPVNYTSKNKFKIFVDDKACKNLDCNKIQMPNNGIDHDSSKINFSFTDISSLTDYRHQLSKISPSKGSDTVNNDNQYSNTESFKDIRLPDINSNLEDCNLIDARGPVLTDDKTYVTYYKYNDSFLAEISKSGQNLVDICKNVTCQGNNYLAPCCGAKAICPPGMCKGEDFSYLLPIPGYPTSTTPNSKAGSDNANTTQKGSKFQNPKIRMPRENSMRDLVRFQLMHGQSSPNSKCLIDALREVNLQSQKINREFHPLESDQIVQAPGSGRQIALQNTLFPPHLIDYYKVLDSLKSSITDSLIHSQINKNIEEKEKFRNTRNFVPSSYQQYFPENNPYLAKLIMNEAEEEARRILDFKLKGNHVPQSYAKAVNKEDPKGLDEVGQTSYRRSFNEEPKKALDVVNLLDMEKDKFSDKINILPALNALTLNHEQENERPYTKLVQKIEKLNTDNDANDIFDRYSGLRGNFSSYYLPQINSYGSSPSEKDEDMDTAGAKLDEHNNNLTPMKIKRSSFNRRKRNYDIKILKATKDIQNYKETFNQFHNELNDLQKYISLSMDKGSSYNKQNKVPQMNL